MNNSNFNNYNNSDIINKYKKMNLELDKIDLLIIRKHINNITYAHQLKKLSDSTVKKYNLILSNLNYEFNNNNN